MAPPPDVRMHELLAEGDFVRALARQLVAGADADDLAQETWLAAVAKRPASVRQPRSWLARVMHRLAANRSRTDRRRIARERAVGEAVVGEAPSTDTILACEQVRQRVVAAVLALDEPFRGTVIARFYECLDSVTIAARDHVEVGTVRSRLKRGLERLRERLDGEHGGQRVAWAAPLALLRREPPPTSALPLGAAMTIPKKAAALVAVVMLATLALWGSGMLAPDGSPPATPPLTPATANVATAPSDEAIAGQRTASAAPPTDRSGEPRERIPYPLADEPIDEVPVRVLDAETRQPVAGAEVLFAPFRVDFLHPSTRGDQQLHELANSDAFLERFGSRTRTGPTGEATIRLPRSGSSVIASHGDRRVRADVRPTRVLPGERVTLWLEAVRWVHVRVVGEATGAPVEGALLDTSHAERSAVVRRAGGGSGLLGPSDGNGMIAIPVARAQHTLRVRPWAVAPRGWQSIELPAAFDGVTEVRYPATGSITIELRTPSGTLWPVPIEAGISCSESDTSSSTLSGPIAWCRAERGTYRVPHVALGLTWKVSASGDIMRGTWFSTIAVGPRRPGEEVRVVLHAAAEPCVAWADLRTAEGAIPPSGSHWLVCQGEGDVEDRRGWGLWDPEGRIGWTVNPALPAAGRVEVLGGSSAPVLAASWRLEAATAGEHELGTLVLGEVPLLVAGRIEVDAGWNHRLLRVLVETDPSARGEWRPLTVLDVDAGTDPTFAARGTTRPSRVRVSVLADAHCLPTPPQVVDVGTKGVRFAVAPGLALRARVLAPSAYAQALSVRASRADGAPLPPVAAEATWDEPRPRSEGTRIDFDGAACTFAWPALPAGVYRVDVFAPGVGQALATIDGVRVEAGEPADPRLDPIDVRSARTLTVSLTTLPSGPLSVTDGGVAAFPSGAPGDTVYGLLFDARGEARLLVGAESVDVLVAVPGFRLWRATGVTASTLQVQLEPPFTLPFRLAPRVAEALSGHRVHVELDPCAPGGEQPAIWFTRPGEREPAVQTMLHCLQCLADGGRGTLDDSRAAGAIPVAAAGRFAVRLAIETPREWVHVNEAWKGWQSSPVVPSEVVCKGTGDPVLVVDVEEAVLAKVVDQLSRGR